MKKFDFVIPLKRNESAWNDCGELKLLLRSVEENFPVNRIIILSDSLPEWLDRDKIVWIETNDPFKHNKDANLIRKILIAAQLKDITPTFYWSCDDHLIFRKPKNSELNPFFISDLHNEQSYWWSGTWKTGMKRTMDLLISKNKSTYHYDAHIPQPINAAKFFELFNDLKLEENKRYCINTLYFNQAGLRKHNHIGILKATFEKPVTELSQIKTSCHNRLFVGYNNRGLTKELQEFILNKFPKKSCYEII